MDNGITIRPLESGEYEKAVACLVEARGLHYYEAKYYDAAYLSGGEHELFAAFDSSGEMAGVTGISRAPFHRERATLSLLNMRPGFTGQGIAKKLLRHTVERLCARGVRSVKGHVVTCHTAVQGVLETFGLRPTGLLRGVRDGKNATWSTSVKYGLAVYVRNVSVRDVTLYAHSNIVSLAARVYGELAVKAAFVHDGVRSGNTVLRHCYNVHDSVLWVQVLESGPDLTQQLAGLRKQYGASPTFTATILLNLCSPSAVYGYEALRGAGYRFCGFDPLGEQECAVFFIGYSQEADMSMSPRLEVFCRELAQYE